MRLFSILSLSSLLVLNSHAQPATQTKLSLNMSNIIQAYGVNFYPPSNATAILDEQDLFGDPANGKGTSGCCKTAFEPTWTAEWYGPQLKPFFIIDLFQRYTLTSVWIYRGWGNYNLTVSVSDYPADPTQASNVFTWAFGHTDPGGQGYYAHNYSTNYPTGRYLSVSFSNPCGSSVLEMGVYGTVSSVPQLPTTIHPSTPTATSSTISAPLFSELLGTNGFALAGMDNVSSIVGSLREYNDWDWIENVQMENSFQPTYDVNFYLDDWYGNLSSLNIKNHQCMQKSAGWIHNHNNTEEGWKPLNDTILAIPLSAMNASYYTAVADHAYQVVARYGSKVVPDSNLQLASNQPRNSGLNTLTGLEIFNEVDGTWNGGRNGFFAPYEYAAMLSAAYDGHCSTMGPLMGGKNADPTFPIIHSGLAGLELAPDYFEAVRLWSISFRKDKQFPADVLNVHTYCRNPAGTIGVAPESCNIYNDLLRLCTYRDTYLPTLPIWLSEFGYDTVGGPSFSPGIGPYTPQDVQAMWLIRTVLLLARLVSPNGNACISRAHMYMLADVESTSGGVFATSGLLASSDFGYAPKVSWYYYSVFTKYLGSYTYTTMLPLDNTLPSYVMAQCFVNSATNSYGIILWSATSNATIINNADIPVSLSNCPVLNKGSQSITMIIPAVNQMKGNQTTLTPSTNGNNQVVSLTISEIPIMLFDGSIHE